MEEEAHGRSGPSNGQEIQKRATVLHWRSRAASLGQPCSLALCARQWRRMHADRKDVQVRNSRDDPWRMSCFQA
eukprot:6368898-Pyramimonas_sp.AAC.1